MSVYIVNLQLNLTPQSMRYKTHYVVCMGEGGDQTHATYGMWLEFGDDQ